MFRIGSPRKRRSPPQDERGALPRAFSLTGEVKASPLQSAVGKQNVKARVIRFFYSEDSPETTMKPNSLPRTAWMSVMSGEDSHPRHSAPSRTNARRPPAASPRVGNGEARHDLP